MSFKSEDCKDDIGTQYDSELGEFFGIDKNEIKTIVSKDIFKNVEIKLEEFNMDEIDYNKMNKCGTNMEVLISLDKRAQKDLKNNTHGIGQEEVITIIREFIRLQNDYIALKEQISFLEAKMEKYGCGFDEYDSDF